MCKKRVRRLCVKRLCVNASVCKSVCVKASATSAETVCVCVCVCVFVCASVCVCVSLLSVSVGLLNFVCIFVYLSTSASNLTWHFNLLAADHPPLILQCF